MKEEFNLSKNIQYKDLDDFNCEFIDVKKIKKFIKLLKEKIKELEIYSEKVNANEFYRNGLLTGLHHIKEEIDKLSGSALI